MSNDDWTTTEGGLIVPRPKEPSDDDTMGYGRGMVDLAKDQLGFVDDDDLTIRQDDHGIRPAGRPDQCLYCRRYIGEQHANECVIVVREVEYSVHLDGKVVGAFTTKEPSSWDKEMCEFRHNEGGWCADNLIDDEGYVGEPLPEASEEGECLCNRVRLRVVRMGNKRSLAKD